MCIVYYFFLQKPSLQIVLGVLSTAIVLRTPTGDKSEASELRRLPQFDAAVDFQR